MKKKVKFPYGIRSALLGAEKSTSKVQVGAALITRDGRIIVASNNDKSSPGATRWYAYYDQGQHAEYNLFSKSLLELLPIRGTVYIARRLADGSTGIAKPCKACRAMLTELGIRKIVYTNYDNTYVEEQL